MRLASRAALWLLLTVGLCSCTRTVEVKAETHETASLVEQQLSKEKVVETVQVGPETVTTTVEEYGSPQEEKAEAPAGGLPDVQGAQGRASVQDGQAQALQPEAKRVSKAPVLIRRTVVVDQRGPSTDTKATESTASSSATQAIKLDAKTETTTKTRYGPPLWLLALLAAALALVGWLAFKFSLFGRIAAFLKG